jgi:hypothetical protein
MHALQAAVVYPLNAEPDGNGGAEQSTFDSAATGHTPAPAGWSGIESSVDVYRDENKNAALCVTLPPDGWNYSYNAQFITGVYPQINTEYNLSFLAGSHVNWENGIARYAVTLGTWNNGTFNPIGTSQPATVLFKGALTYIGDNKGVYLGSFRISTGSTVPAGLLAVQICVTSYGVAWPAIDNVRLESGPFPVITAGPAAQTVMPGSIAAFSVSASGINSYQWYKGVYPLVNGSNISGADTAVLTIANAQLVDEAVYFCKVNNGSSVFSGRAPLLIRKIITKLDFDGNVYDSSGLGNHGVVAGTISYGTGVSGLPNSSLVLSNPSGAANFVRVPGPVCSGNFAADMLAYTGSITISCWIKPAFVQDYEMYVSMGIVPWGGWYAGRYGSTYAATFVCEPGSQTIASAPLNDSQWHLYTGVIDAAQGKRYLFIDGLKKAEASSIVLSGIDLVIGAINWKQNRTSSDNYLYGYSGLLDNVRIYNYALSPFEIAQLYYEVTNRSLCIEPVPGDINDDCKVNFCDFALLMEQWLNCSLTPAIACEF